MNITTATISSDHSWSRRCSTETVFSIQGKETDASDRNMVNPGARAGVVTGSSGPEDLMMIMAYHSAIQLKINLLLGYFNYTTLM